MLNVISTIPPSLEKFLGEFKDLFIGPRVSRTSRFTPSVFSLS